MDWRELPMNEALREQLVRHEGLRLLPYRDSVGKWTIGCGRNLTDCGISHAEAMAMLEADISKALNDLLSFSWFKSLNEARLMALIDMRFNLGPTRFRGFKATLAALERGDYQTAAAQMRKSKWYGQVGRRGEELARMVETGQLPKGV